MYSMRVVNRALRALGEPPVDTLEDMDEAPSSVVKLVDDYDDTVGATLKAIGRGEFIQHATLSPVAAPGDRKFPYRFQMPADGLAFMDPPEVAGLEMAIETVNGIDQHVIRSTVGVEIDLSYVRRVNLDLLSGEVIDALGLSLAAKCAYQVTAQRDWSTRVEDKAKEAIVLARSMLSSSTENRPQRASRMGAVRGGARR